MEVEDYVEPSVALAVLGTAAAFSSPVRQFLHKGAVYAVAGAIVAGEAVVGLGRGFNRGLHGGGDGSPPTGEEETGE